MVIRLPASRTCRLYPRKYSWYSFLFEAVSTQEHSAMGRILYQWKFPLTQSGIEPATFRFVAQHLNHCATDFHSVSFRGLHKWKLRHLATVGRDSAILFIRSEPILGTLLKLGASVTLFVVTDLKNYFWLGSGRLGVDISREIHWRSILAFNKAVGLG